MKHTPGPWVVNDFCTEGGADTAVWTSHDPHTAKSICECHYTTARQRLSGEDGCHQLEAEANAKLIAAAPELLAIAKEYAASCPNCDGKGKRRHSFDNHLVDCQKCAGARAVIARAE
jgi:hypothetical protein